jgi:hypothetical protein
MTGMVRRRYYAQDVPEGARIADGEHKGSVILRRDWAAGISTKVMLHLDGGYRLDRHPSSLVDVLVQPDAPPSIAEIGRDS